MNVGEAARTNPKTAQLAKAGVPWAMKLIANGWAGLTTAQKRAARAALALPVGQTVVVPKRVRLLNGSGRRDGPGQAGKVLHIDRMEYVGTVVANSGVAPNYRKWVVNPGNPELFPTIQLLASMFNKYTVTKLSVRYASQRSFESNGLVSIGFNPDASEPVPVTRSQFYDLKVKTDTAVQTPVILGVPTDGKARYVRDSASDDSKLVDFGAIVVGTQGCDDDTTVLGQLFVDIAIRFSDPTFAAELTQTGDLTQIRGPEYATVSAGTTLDIVLRVPGRWMVIFEVTAGLNTPVVTGEGATGVVHWTTESGASSMGVVFLTAQVPGGKVTTNWNKDARLTMFAVSRA